jgi:hypothetical protein
MDDPSYQNESSLLDDIISSLGMGAIDEAWQVPDDPLAGSVMVGPTPEQLYIGDIPESPSTDYSFFQLDDISPKFLAKGLLGLAGMASIKPIGGGLSALFKELAPEAIKLAEKRVVEELPTETITDAVITKWSPEVQAIIDKLNGKVP